MAGENSPRKSSAKRIRNVEVPPASAGPLAWLVGFANVHIDDGQPRPSLIRFEDSRFLGRSAREKGYLLDPDQPHEIHDDPRGPSWGTVVIQQRRDVVLQWHRHPDGTMVPLPPRRPMVTPEALKQFILDYPPRTAMPELAASSMGSSCGT